jgi:hypothetical protein
MEKSLTGMLIPIGTIVLIVLMQMSFWFPMGITKKQRTNTSTAADHTTGTGTSTDNATDAALMKEKVEVDKKEDIIINEQQSSCTIIPDQSSKNKTSNESNEVSNESGRDKNEKEISNSSSSLDTKKCNNGDEVENNKEDNEEDWFKINDGSTKTGNNNNNNNWRCACEFGFLPAGMLKTFGNAEAIAKLGIGQCYHKQS